MEALHAIAWILAFLLAIVAIGFALRAFVKTFSLMRVLRTKVVSTGDAAVLAADPDRERVVAVHGTVALEEAARAPVSSAPCLAYRLEITGRQLGARPIAGPEELVTKRGGARFTLDDGSGPVVVDLRAGRTHADWWHADEDCNFPFGAVEDGAPQRSSVEFGDYELAFADLPAAVRAWDGVESASCRERILPLAEEIHACGTARAGALRDGDYQGIIVRAQSPREVKIAHLKGVGIECTAAAVTALMSWGLFLLSAA